MNMTKAELIAQVAEKADTTKVVAEKTLNALLESIQGALVDGKAVTLVGFGTFAVSERAARKGRNPQTNQEIEIPAANVPRFRPGKGLKEAVNKK